MSDPIRSDSLRTIAGLTKQISYTGPGAFFHWPLVQAIIDGEGAPSMKQLRKALKELQKEFTLWLEEEHRKMY